MCDSRTQVQERQRQHTVGMWLTYGSATIVFIVCSTDRASNS
jgi:high-affinity nickel permease